MQNIHLCFKSKRLLFHIKLHPGITLTNILNFCGMPTDTVYNPYYAPLQDNGLVTAVMTADLSDYRIYITPNGNAYLLRNIKAAFKYLMGALCTVCVSELIKLLISTFY